MTAGRPSYQTPEQGQVFDLSFPFIRTTYGYLDGDECGGGVVECETWRPGTRQEDDGPADVVNVADGIGRMVLTVVSTHKPGKFSTRVFYTRHFIDPDGKRFGKGALRVRSLYQFHILASGYRVPYEMAGREKASPRQLSCFICGTPSGNTDLCVQCAYRQIQAEGR